MRTWVQGGDGHATTKGSRAHDTDGLRVSEETEPQPYPVVGARVREKRTLVPTEKHGQCWIPGSPEIAGQIAEISSAW